MRMQNQTATRMLNVIEKDGKTKQMERKYRREEQVGTRMKAEDEENKGLR